MRKQINLDLNTLEGLNNVIGGVRNSTIKEAIAHFSKNFKPSPDGEPDERFFLCTTAYNILDDVLYVCEKLSENKNADEIKIKVIKNDDGSIFGYCLHRKKKIRKYNY